MPISAQEWRIRTGMINASRSHPYFTSTIASTPRPFPRVKHNHKTGLPPPTWTGYRAAMVMLSVPMLYKFYTAILMVVVYMFKDSTVAGTQHTTELAGHNNTNFGYHCSLLSFLCVFVHAMIVMALVVMNDREQDPQWRQPMCSGTLQCADGSCSRVISYSWSSLCFSLAGSAVHHLPTLALLMLVLLCGDVERNPGPPGPDLKILMEKLSSEKSKWHLIGIQLGVKLSQLHLIEHQYSDIGRRLSETLQYWLDGNTEVPICWKSIVEALKCVDNKVLADELHEEYCTVERVEDTTSESTTSNVTDIPPSHSASASVASPSVMIGAPQCLVVGRHISFPSLGLGGHSGPTCEHLQARLYTDSVRMMGKFQTLLNTIMRSLKAQQIPVKSIIAQIAVFGTFVPACDVPDQPILIHELEKLRAEAGTSIDDIHFVVAKYSSFFNYHIVEQIINDLGTQEDMEKLKEYERAFQEYAERKVIECPSQVALIDDTNQTRIFVKLDDSYDRYTVSQLQLFIGKLSEVFHLKEGVLQLVNVNSGCFELTFQVPLFVQKAMFPLSLEQEKALTQLGVLKLCSLSQSDDKEDGGDDDRHDDLDNDSAIGTGTVISELTELSEDFIDRELTDPYSYHGLTHDDESNQPKETHVGPINMMLHNSSFTGKLEQVKKLVETESFSPLTLDTNGNTAIHYAAAGNQLEVIKYFVRTQGFNPVTFNRNGETPLHVAARRGHMIVVKYFVEEEQLDPLEQDGKFGRTALHASCLCKNVGVVRFLVEQVKKYVAVENIAQLKTMHGHTPIHYAAVGGDLNIVKFLINELNCNPNTKDHNGFTPFHAAAQGGHINIVEYLIDNSNCDPSMPDNNKFTPLHSAALKGHLNVVKFLTSDKFAIDPECKTNKGNTPLRLAALNGHIETVQFFITELKCDHSSPNSSGRTTLHAAADGGQLNILKYLIDDSNCDPSQPDDNRFTPLHSAALKGHLNVVKFLTLDKHVDPQCRDSDGDTPLRLAAFNGHVETVQFFIMELKCDPGSPNTSGRTTLHAAADGGHLNILEYLINDSNCDPSQSDDNRFTPLHNAALKGHLNVVKFLTLDKHVDPECRDSDGDTPLRLAALKGHFETVQFFTMELKCDPISPNSSGKTTLHAAADGGHLNILEYLINDSSCDPSQSDDNRFTPLHSAAIKGHLNVVKFLTLDKHVDPECRDSDGDTPLRLAALKGHNETAQFFITELKCVPISPNKSGRTTLHAAADGGHLNILKYLIDDSNCDPSQPDDNRFTPLHSAALKGHLNVLKFLTLDKHVNPESRDSDGDTPLRLAALEGHIEAVQVFITELKCDPISPNSSGRTTLHAAADGGHLNILEYLINDSNCDPSQPDDNRFTPLHSAALKGHLNVLKFLTLDKHVDPESRDSDGDTPLRLAALEGHNETVQFFIAELKCDPISPNSSGRTTLHAAADGGHFNVLEYLINDSNCDPSQSDDNRFTPLHNAALKGHLNVVKFLTLDKHVDPECRDSDGDTPLRLAALKGHFETVQFFTMELKCDPISPNSSGRTTLHAAADGGHLNILEYLINDSNCDPSQSDDNRFTPLHSAALKGHLNVVKFLTLDKHVDPECRDSDGDTPLRLAALKGHNETVQFFITELKCVPISPNKSGRTTLHAAADGGHLNILKYLINDSNCDPSQPDDNRFTPLHSAALKGHLNVVKFLTLDKHVDPECRDSDGDTPLRLAALKGHIETVQFFITELKCDPISPNTPGRTTLHAAADDESNQPKEEHVRPIDLTLHNVSFTGKLVETESLTKDSNLLPQEPLKYGPAAAIQDTSDHQVSETALTANRLHMSFYTQYRTSIFFLKMRFMLNNTQVTVSLSSFDSGQLQPSLKLNEYPDIQLSAIQRDIDNLLRNQGNSHVGSYYCEQKDSLFIPIFEVAFPTESSLKTFLENRKRIEEGLVAKLTDRILKLNKSIVLSNLTVQLELYLAVTAPKSARRVILVDGDNCHSCMQTYLSSSSFGISELFQTDTSPIPELDELMSALHSVLDWFGLGLKFNVPVAELEKIRVSHNSDVNSCKRDMLIMCLKQNKLTWPGVMTVLCEMDENKLAQEIATSYGIVLPVDTAVNLKEVQIPAVEEMVSAGEHLSTSHTSSSVDRADSELIAQRSHTQTLEEVLQQRVEYSERQVQTYHEQMSTLTLPGVQFIFEGKLTIKRSDQLQTLAWKNHGLKIHVPPGALPDSADTCDIDVATSFSGNFILPPNYTLVSAIYYVQPSMELLEPVTLEIEHCCSIKDQSDAAVLTPIFAQCSHRNPPYTFQPLKKDSTEFASFVGRFEVFTFSLFGCVKQKSTGKQQTEEFYCGRVYYRQNQSNEWFFVRFVAIPRLADFQLMVEKHYSNQQCHWQLMTTIEFNFPENSNVLEILVNKSGITTDNGWVIKPRVLPLQIYKKRILFRDSPEPASCEMTVKWSRRHEDPLDLEHWIEMKGISLKELLITLSPQSGTDSLKYSSPSQTSVPVKVVDKIVVERPSKVIDESKDWAAVCGYLEKLDRPQIVRLGGVLGLSLFKLEKMMVLPDDMVRAWLRKQDSVKETTWDALVKALIEINQQGVADEIKCTKATT